MRMLKCHLANNREGHFVTANEAMNAPGRYGAVPPVAVRYSSTPVHLVKPPGLSMISEQFQRAF